ncbi:putative fatty acyl-CoA reductase CG5065 [Adelges cooleyi]|uniref:putative fatty acyl-CoA reductase CG5065 n=1 Tax=Adelges cooleyi TaxID=133065 RepID=UPI00218023A0|nr:putative fatty acyl-CoA reductase CG5065 [Adelges cooleyi]
MDIELQKMGVRDFFKGRNVFVTGGTGFMGKVLIEKLVRSCPGIGQIYILVRNRKGKDIKDRIKEMCNVQLFDTIKSRSPGLLEEKLVPVLGNMTDLRLGLSDKDYSMLVENVSVIFHAAASVRFDEPIRDATIMNVRGTREVVQLAKDIKNLAVLLHVSTAYCNCNRIKVDEKVYESPMNWRDAIAIAENMDPTLSSILTKKFLGSFPNTYTLTKLFAEQIINEERYNIPSVIFRPSIVISSYNDPVSGWLDNFNGPIGLMVACGKGIVRVTLAGKTIIPDYMAVDVSVKAMIVAAWDRATSSPGNNGLLPVYNSASVSKSISNNQLTEMGLKFMQFYPFEIMMWRPQISITSCYYYYYTATLLQQVLPSILVDGLLNIFGIPHKQLLGLQKKIYIMTMALSYFTTQSWSFQNTKFLSLIDKIPEVDHEEFNYDFKNIDQEQFFENALLGAQKYMFNVDTKRFPIARRNLWRLTWLDRLVQVIAVVLLVWLLIQFDVIPCTYLQYISYWFKPSA